jgi:hypothetical protein
MVKTSGDPDPKAGLLGARLRSPAFQMVKTSADLDPKAGLLGAESKSRLQIIGGEAASAKGR